MQDFSPKKISILIIIIVLVWIATGFIFGTSREESGQQQVSAQTDLSKLLKIEVLSAKPFTRLITLNGYTKANRMVELKPEVEGKITELPVKKGSQVSEGQVIVRLDDRDRKEKLAEAKAKVAARQIEYKAAQTLESKGYRPRIGLADSKANLEMARVELAQAQLNVDNTVIRAPFAGRLEELNVEIGDFVLSGFFGSMNGQAMARLVEDDPLLVTGQVSEKDLGAINREVPVDVVLADGREVQGNITFIGQYADSQSRSFPVEVSVPNADHSIPVGITATIKLSGGKGQAYLVSSSILALDDAGNVGVKLVDDKGVIHFTPVEILANTNDGLWIGGLPPTIRLVTQGQAFVNEGQTVDITPASPDTAGSDT